MRGGNHEKKASEEEEIYISVMMEELPSTLLGGE